MKKYLPVIAIVIFVVALLGFSNYIWIQQEKAQAERMREAERHLVVYSDMPADVNNDLAKQFYDQTRLRVQIVTKTDKEIQHAVEKDADIQPFPDVIIAAQPVLQEGQQHGLLKPYASQMTEQVPYSFKDADGYWTGLWLDPMIMVVSQDYYFRNGLQLQTWDDLLTDPKARLTFPDLAATDIAGDFLCSLVEMRGQENSMQYLKNLQHHVISYSQSMAPIVRRVASGESDIGIADAATVRQYMRDHAPLYILYPQDGTSYWLIGAAVMTSCEDEELSGQFIDWLLSDHAADILRKNHLYFDFAAENHQKELDAKGQQVVLFPVQKNYTEQGRKALQDWWIKTVRFGKDS